MIKREEGGKGYRLLRDNEIIKDGDEFLSRITNRWNKCVTSIGKRPGIYQKKTFKVRRKL